MGEHRPSIRADYDTDFFAWTQHQAKLLRTFRKWEADLPAGLDLDQIAEEIEDLGGAELNTVKSLVRQILVHLIKAASEPKSDAVAHWRAEASAFHADLLDHYAPSMRRQIDVQSVWRRARGLADLRLQERGASVAADIPNSCPYSVADIVSEDFRFDEALKALGSARKSI